MKNFLLLFCFFSCCFQTKAANETEPNNQKSTANKLLQDTIMQGATFSGDDDYFIGVPGSEGKISIYYSFSSPSSGNDFYVYFYNKNLNLTGSKSNTNSLSGNDTLTIQCVAKDTVYIRIFSSASCNYSFRFSIDSTGFPDVLPNENSNNATYFADTDSIQGRIGYSSVTTDANDWYKSLQPSDGMLRVYIERTNTSNSSFADFYLYVYNNNLIQIGSLSEVNEKPGVILRDTLDIYCRASDTVYFRVFSTGCYSYKIKYKVIDNSVTDMQPNETSATALYFDQTDSVQGKIGYNTVTTDANDWYKTLQPSDGMLRVYIERTNTSNSSTADFYLYVYNNNLNQIGSLSKVNEKPGVILRDTIDIYCRASDTVYFRVFSTGCYSYKIKYKVIDNSVTDMQPNETSATALYFDQTDSLQGKIGYNTVTTDANDWYKTLQPSDGMLRVYVERTNTSNSSFADFYVYVYNNNLNQIGSLSKVNEKPGVLLRDTLDIYCRASDTLYFRILSTACYSYKLKYEVLSGNISDKASNNTRQTATLIQPNVSTQGKIGYVTVSSDNDDYYLLSLSTESRVSSFINFNNTSNSTGADFYFYIYNKKGVIVARLSRVNLARGIHRDTLVYPCAPADSIYFRIFSSGCFEYSFTSVVEDNQPHTKIIAARTGNEVGFAAQVSNVDTFYWDFGNGQTTGRKYPKQTFGIGAHTIKLIGTNLTCNKSFTDSFFIEVKGVEYFTPIKSGTGGDLAMTIYGGGLDSNTKVRIRNSDTVYESINVVSNSKRNALIANFDLHQAALGSYDVEIDIQGVPGAVFKDGFTIEKFQYPYCKAEVIGPSRWRINRNTNFEIKVTNDGNVTANGVVIGFAYPKSVEVKLIPKPTRLDPTQDVEVDIDGEKFAAKGGEFAAHYDSAAKAYPIDSIYNSKYDGMLYLLTLAKIPANSTITLPFTAKTTTTGTPEFYVYSYHPNRYGSKGTEHWSNTTNQIMEQGIDLLDMGADKTNNSYFKAFSKSLKVGQKHLALAGANAGAHFDAWINDYEVTPEMYGILNAELDEANAFAVKTLAKEVGGAAVQKGLGKMINSEFARNSALNKKLTSPNLSMKEWRTLNNEFLNSNSKLNKILKLDDIFTTSKDLESLYGKLATLRESVKGCPELEPQLDELLKKVEEQFEHQDPKKKKTNSVRSMDPNEIYGPEGIDVQRFRKDLDVMHYFITCENIDTAQAAAQEVTIIDTLNPAVFDLSTLSFGNVNIGNKTMRLLSNRNEFFGELSLYPEMPIVVRVMATLNKTTGEVRWTMTGIDTNTYDLPIDPNLGILPPNTNPPFGEASVSYTVKLKPNLANGTVINNRANIIFDENEPILTNTWTNVIDIAPPTSSILQAEIRNDTSIAIKLQGIDNESGLYHYKLFVQRDNNTEWINTGHTFTDSTTFIGGYGHTYRFYVTGEDRVGNEENKIPTSEAEVTTKPKYPFTGEVHFVIIPNPNNGKFELRNISETPLSDFKVYNLVGTLMYELNIELEPGAQLPVSLSGEKNGLYFIRGKRKDGKTTTEKLLIGKQ
ncbi:MAG: T9SS type A sorting domain-containing protein [Flavobacteriales bacterium]|nr:T9SS type A sorting domain-containing protein [Flavobacteriales bacterium]